jgi:hypothetical protein
MILKGRQSGMDNVVEFKRKDDVFILGFMMPEIISINKKGDENITLEAKDGKAHAWVVAKNKIEAKKKLTDMITNITEWLD